MSTQPPAFALARRGQLYVRIIAGTIVGVSLTSALVYNVGIGPDRLPQQLLRLLSAIVVGYGLVRARPWARWLTCVLCLLSLVLPLVALLRPGAPAGVLLFAAGFAGVYGAMGCVLIGSPGVAAFFRLHGVIPADPGGDVDRVAASP